ncbi:MAG: fluoride efflux transporter CrcB [Haliscomenobacter sp.]
MSTYFPIFIGGGLGSLVRFYFSKNLTAATGFHWGTFSANLVSCFILGLLFSLRLRGDLSHQVQLLLITGFCGGFSTFSTFSLEVFQDLQEGRVVTALLYAAISMLSGLLAILAGIRLLQ